MENYIDNNVVNTKQFSNISRIDEARTLLLQLQISFKLSDKELKNLQERLWKFSAAVRQPRKDDRSCNKTPYFDRWNTNPNSYLTVNDPRYCSEERCEQVYLILLAQLLETVDIPAPEQRTRDIAEGILERPLNPKSLMCVKTGCPIMKNDLKLSLGRATQRLGGYEIPTTYRIELSDGGKHEPNNVGWMLPIHAVYDLRDILELHLQELRVPTNGIDNALDKIQVKSYCTDKQTMPPYFSNRDIRWATWPQSVQYSSHYQCSMIELELLAELFEFYGAPVLNDDIKVKLYEALGRRVIPNNRCCFITGKHMSFDEYVQAAVDTRGGKSNYHVGHVVPLTRGGKHEYKNISWSSDDGNRIQGNDTLEEIKVKLLDAVEYHIKQEIIAGDFAINEKEKRLSKILNEIINKRKNI